METLDDDARTRTTAGTALQAVLFDMDGTLVETEQYWGEAMFALARELGGRMSDRARQRTVGTSMPVAMDILYTDLGVVRSEAQSRADARWIEDRVAGLLGGDIHWRPGARELIAELRHAAVPTALVTTTPRRLADVVLAAIGAAFPDVPPFDVTVCGDEVPARKPDPAPYRQAMAALGVPPEGCVVLEDSVAGVTAGLAAGAAVLGVPSLQPLEPAEGLVLRETLAGVGLADLDAVLAARAVDILA
ncbi:HAD family hydrolase [Geodermatophilus sabuli]|uniref:Haloacid dehalogenase superfamily, subfamily IA, variant 3 with third motif having DD or ED n=1 Tax=Geodermatophilus sabuli TaxID=1564158 RepID=A0A285EBW3_9ACTN|nr:HAD family phosphatase [Geodermatophilus sabuli]MBB3084253.1 HAD superfamily hydrolase (TIGR01509 family) [Geodermatophilus sabuli]SNX96477.1 haloacid dehalogenase superfamily, subfamily IA, variant 3 with third motif having DD or ED [Geodermatophilus sabuli]